VLLYKPERQSGGKTMWPYYNPYYTGLYNPYAAWYNPYAYYGYRPYAPGYLPAPVVFWP
jgi:hypothetical protein